MTEPALMNLPIPLLPNRVWRTYSGGRTLDRIEGVDDPRDGEFPEDWIGSVTRATNTGRSDADEGISRVRGPDGSTLSLSDLFKRDPEYFFGPAHVKAFGPQPGLLVKFLDPSIRLHFQVHPTRDFARRVLSAPSGKTEAYYVLSTREDLPEPAYVYAGFQRPPAPNALRRMIEEQRIDEIESCFDRIPVRAGDALLIPGGTPHALGPGIFLVEIQEPSDLVVRFEFERGGRVLPEAARFMGRDVDFGLSVFNLDPLDEKAVKGRILCTPKETAVSQGAVMEGIIGTDRTDCFGVRRLKLKGPWTETITQFRIAIVTRGSVSLKSKSGTTRFNAYDRFLLPAGLGEVEWICHGGECEILFCLPPVP